MDLGAFGEFGILIGVATVVALLMRLLKQPLIIGHIITGFLVGRYALSLFHSLETIELFGHLGIAFLLFSVGLGLNPRSLRQYGLAAIVNTFGQVVLTGAAGVAVSLLLGYNLVTALYIGVAISFSSTVIVLKLLADKGDLDKLYVKISIGSLLLQDLVAIILLFVIPVISGSAGFGLGLIKTLGLGLAAGVGVFAFSHYVIGALHPYLTKSQELLFLFANAWAIGVAILFSHLGFSLEGGALLAGVALASLPSSHEISAHLSPLRDFFIVAFFILLGTRMVVSDFDGLLLPALVLSLFVLLINPLIQLVVMGALGYRKKTSFQTGMMSAQISEFSLILVGLGVSLGQVSASVLTVITMVGIITIFISTYLIYYSDSLYRVVAPYLGLFERKIVREKAVKLQLHKHILIGSGRVSHHFISLFQKEGRDFLVLEHDPVIVKKLQSQNIPAELGDASDPDLLADLRLENAHLVVSTAADFETDRLIISAAKRGHTCPLVVVVGKNASEARLLYNYGADYVILPHDLGGAYASRLLKSHLTGDKSLVQIGQAHLARLAKVAP